MLEFSTKRPEDVKEVYITGILALLNKFIIVDRDNKKTEIILGKWRIFVVNKFDEIYIWNYSSGVKRNYSSGLLRWSSLQTKVFQRHTEFHFVGLKNS